MARSRRSAYPTLRFTTIVPPVSGAAIGSKRIVGVYVRLLPAELRHLQEHPDALLNYDLRGPLKDGRALDLGRAWESLAVLVDGGVRLPERGPTLGQLALPDCDHRAAWSCVEAAGVVTFAEVLATTCRQFAKLYGVDGEDTDPYLSDGRTGGYRGNQDYLIKKLEQLSIHYQTAVARGEAMLVRIGESL